MDTWIACVPSAVCKPICSPSPRLIEGRLFVESQSLRMPQNISRLCTQ